MDPLFIQLSYGINCKNNKVPLEPAGVDHLYEMIANGNKDLIDFTKNLRSVLRYSKERYRAMKTGLPFFSCSTFDPPHRSIKNFKSAHGLVVDIDSDQVISSDLIDKCKSDPRIVLGYISPSNMGLKLIFIFEEPLTDAETYTRVYKTFSHQFATDYHLADKIDQKNCDVSRISFLCFDPNAWYNADYISLDWQAIANETQHLISAPTQDLAQDNITASAYKQILELLDTKPKKIKSVIPIMPEINEVIPDIEIALLSYDINVKEVESIQYGAKLRIIKGKDLGELNIYSGRQGYKVVTSPRKGTHPELNEVAMHIIEGVLIKF